MTLLRKFWTVISVLLTLLLICKIIMAAWFGNPATVVPRGIGIFVLFYLIFIFEGLQVAGLQVKDLDRDAMIQAVENHPVVGLREVLPMYDMFHDNFDSFVTIRQIDIICCVMGQGFLLNSLLIPPELVIGTGHAFLSNLTTLLNGGIFIFIGSTLLPAWWCQLLSQFIADGRATTFLGMPGARLVLRATMLLDKIQLGAPAHSLMNFLIRRGWIGDRQVIPIGKGMYYESSLNFYGRAKKQHDISLSLGTPSRVRETISYVFKGVQTDNLAHKIQLSSPILGDINGKIKLPEGVYCELVAHDSAREKATDTGKKEYRYWIGVELNQPLPREGVETDEVVLEIEYLTNAYSENAGIPYTTEFQSTLPTKDARIFIQGGNKLLKKPVVRIVEEVNGEFAPVQQNGNGQIWTVSTPLPENNTAEIQLACPFPAIAYRIDFTSIEIKASGHVVADKIQGNGAAEEQAFQNFTIKLSGPEDSTEKVTRGTGRRDAGEEKRPGGNVIISKHIDLRSDAISGRYGG